MSKVFTKQVGVTEGMVCQIHSSMGWAGLVSGIIKVTELIDSIEDVSQEEHDEAMYAWAPNADTDTDSAAMWAEFSTDQWVRFEYSNPRNRELMGDTVLMPFSLFIEHHTTY